MPTSTLRPGCFSVSCFSIILSLVGLANLCPLTFRCKKGTGNWGIGKNQLSNRELLTKYWTRIFSRLLRNHSSRPGLSASGPRDLLALALGKSWNLRKQDLFVLYFLCFQKGLRVIILFLKSISEEPFARWTVHEGNH